jgi:NADH-quinone oxidoreductase subunit D
MATQLNFSPIHLAGSQGLGAFGINILEDGGVISEVAIEVGFGRRNIEALVLSLPVSQSLNYIDRIDYLSSPAYSYALASAFEETLGLHPPVRAEQIRVIILELNRICNHLNFYIRISKSIGQIALMNHCLREREKFLDVLEMYCGSRLGYGAICLGGVIEDATDGWFFRIEKAIHSMMEFLPDLKSAVLEHPFFLERAKGLAVISNETATKWNIRGPNAKASGIINSDLRKTRPYGAYKELNFTITEPSRTSGDVLARAWVRLDEIKSSSEIILNCFRKIEKGNHRIRVSLDVVPPVGKSLKEVEAPKGSLSVMMESRGEICPANIKIMGPSPLSLQILPKLLIGVQTEDLFLVIHSLDLSFSEVDK